MKLYYLKGACSLAPHIVLEELGLPYETVEVAVGKEPPAGFLEANPLGSVPVLILPDGKPMTEAAVILQYLADLKPEAGLAPRFGTPERYELMKWLNFVATDLHRGLSPLFVLTDMTKSPEAQAEVADFVKRAVSERLALVNRALADRDYLLPGGYSVADPYLYTIMNWAFFMKIDLSPFPGILAHHRRISERPAVDRALRAERMKM